MKRFAVAILLLAASPALGQQPDPKLLQALSGAIRQQREDAYDKAAVAAAQLKVANDEIAALKAAAAGSPATPSPSASPGAKP